MSHAGSQSQAGPSAAQVQQAQRLRSFRSLLDPTDLLPGHNVADLYSLRHLCLQGGGIPDTASSSSEGWIRAQAWRVLLGYLTPEKSEWNRLLEKRRAEYYQFVRDFLPQDGSSPSHKGIPGKLSMRDALLDQIYRDLARSRKNAFAFYREEIKPSSNCPLAPLPFDLDRIEPRIASRYSLLERLEAINVDFAHSMREERDCGEETSTQGQAPRTPQRRHDEGFLKPAGMETTSASEADSPAITLQPASPQSLAATTPDISSVGSDGESYFASADEGEHEADEAKAQERRTYLDRRWHSLLRILYIYSLLNPSTGYVQGMNEVLFVLLYVMGTTGHLPSVHKTQEGATSSPDGSDTAEDLFKSSSDSASSFHYLDNALDSPGSHAEADAFWCFSNLVGDIRDLYDFEGMDNVGIKIFNRRQAEAGSRPITGMAEALKKFSLRLKWLDEPLWSRMRAHSLDPRLPYYSFRWLACMVSTELTLPSVVRIWDAILAESGGGTSTSDGVGSTPKIEFLIDVCCALLTNIRGSLLAALEGGTDDDADGDDSFGRAMQVLQGYPDDDVGPIVEVACLFRQKRLAAPLTGDGPPSEDEDESLLSVRERATKALRTWTQNTSTPSRTPKWLTASPRTPSTPAQTDGLTPTRSASATLFQRYTDALQSSDTAANWSKASTNLTAKAMATWSGNRGAKDGQQSSSLADLRTSLVNRVMSGSPSASSSKDQKQIHPSLRWSVQSMPPDLPLPNVNDSPPGRRDSPIQSPLRGYTSINRLAGPNASNPLHSPDLSSHTSSTPVTSPTSMSFSRSNAGKRGGGPKPLLLTGSARPPREASANGSLSVDEPMSRKVSSGPLATHSNPYIRRKNNGSSSRRDSSYAGSGTSSLADRDSPSIDGMEDSSASTKSESVHNLPSLQAAGRDWLPPVPTSVLPVGLQGSGHGTGLGTVPASAFAKVRMASSGQAQEDRPVFGQVASSGNIPLANKTTLQRKPNRKDSAKEGELGGLASPIGEVGESFPNRDSIGSSITSRRHRQASTTQSSERIEQGLTNDREAEQQKYTLTDEPITSTRANAPTRAGSSSSTKSTGVSRRQRAFSSGKRTRRSLTQASKQEEVEGSSDLVARGGRESMRLGAFGKDMPAVGSEAKAPEIFPPKRLEADPGRLMPAEELLSRLQLDQGYSGGESSGFEDETHSSTHLYPGQSYLSRTASSQGDEKGLGISNLRNDEAESEGYTTADMAAIGSALAFADGGEEEGEESGH